MANKKLKGIVKTGQDALKEEQDLVKSLRETGSSKVIHTVVTEVVDRNT